MLAISKEYSSLQHSTVASSYTVLLENIIQIGFSDSNNFWSTKCQQHFREEQGHYFSLSVNAQPG